jgi:outer membrane beta-barrel protein
MFRCFQVAVVLCALLAASAWAQTEETEAGDTSEVDRDSKGPLRERIRPVSGHTFLKQGRFEISPSATVSVKDAFFTKYIFGGSLTYHFIETMGIGLHGGYSLSTIAGSAQVCTEVCRSPRLDELDGKAPGQITLVGGLDFQWAPIYGKLAVLAENFVHFDLYAIAGATAVQYRAPLATGAVGSENELTFGGTIGAGGRVFLNRWLTVRAEVRDLIYQEVVSPRPATPQPTSLRHQFLFELGLSFFFPTTFGDS